MEWLNALVDYLQGVDYSAAFNTLGSAAQLANTGIGIYGALNAPPPMSYPQDSLGMMPGNEAISPLLRQRKRVGMGRSRADLQAQMGGATISPALWEIMGEPDDSLSIGMGRI